MLRQARAQARTAVQLGEMHPHWRVVLTTYDHPLVRRAANLLNAAGVPRALEHAIAEPTQARPLRAGERLAAEALRGFAYFEELERAHRGHS
jgi:hypothetical protein